MDLRDMDMERGRGERLPPSAASEAVTPSLTSAPAAPALSCPGPWPWPWPWLQRLLAAKCLPHSPDQRRDIGSLLTTPSLLGTFLAHLHRLSRGPSDRGGHVDCGLNMTIPDHRLFVGATARTQHPTKSPSQIRHLKPHSAPLQLLPMLHIYTYTLN